MKLTENQTKWLEALRSGDYEQGKSTLRSNDNKYCCLGVGADVLGVEWLKKYEKGDYLYIGPHSDGRYLTGLGEPELHALGISKSMQGVLMKANDTYSKTFPEIADMLEFYWNDPEPHENVRVLNVRTQFGVPSYDRT